MSKPDPRKELGAYLAHRRKAAGLTQGDVSKALEYMSAQFVSNWERGVSEPPDKALPTIAKLYGIPPREIIEAMLHCELMLARQRRVRLERLFREKKARRS